MNFVVYKRGPGDLFAVFEDDGETGYLYLYDASSHTISEHLHVYDRTPTVEVNSEDVLVLWSANENKCGVSIWEKMRGIIDLHQGRQARVWLEGPDSPAIDNPEWLQGFGVS
jgi:hypothetical protein